MLLLVSFFLGFNTMFLGIIGEYVRADLQPGKIGRFISSMNKLISRKPEKIATLPPRADGSLNLPTLAERERGKIAVTRLICALEQQTAEFRIRFSFWQFF